MRARITRDVPTDHPSFSGAPSNRAQRESFDQITMTHAIRDELNSIGYIGFRIDGARRLNSGEQKKYQFDIVLSGDAEHFEVETASGTRFEPAFNTVYVLAEDGKDFAEPEADADEGPPSAVAAVGAIIAGSPGGNGDGD